MTQEIWIAILSSAGIFSGLTLLITKLIDKATRTKSEKIIEEATAKKALEEYDSIKLDTDVKRVDTSKIKDQSIRSLVADTYVWIDEMNEALSNMRAKNLKLEAAVFELTKRSEQAERMRDWYRSKLKELIEICIVKCPDIDVSAFEKEIEE